MHIEHYMSRLAQIEFSSALSSSVCDLHEFLTQMESIMATLNLLQQAYQANQVLSQFSSKIITSLQKFSVPNPCPANSMTKFESGLLLLKTQSSIYNVVYLQCMPRIDLPQYYYNIYTSLCNFAIFPTPGDRISIIINNKSTYSQQICTVQFQDGMLPSILSFPFHFLKHTSHLYPDQIK